MNYNVYVAELSPDADVREYAVEIQPPLPMIALDGLVKRLTTRSEREFNTLVLAEDVAVTRQDEEGTAFIITPTKGYRAPSTQAVGEEIAQELNPCNLDIHTINIQPVEGYYGLGD
ncbi:MAG: hypothetical protein ACQR33_06905 [Candidatus Saccharibacteria bacterium]